MPDVPSQPDRDTAFTAWVQQGGNTVMLTDRLTTVARKAHAAGWDAATRAQRERIRPVLADAIELAAEAIPYAGDYFRDKWQLDFRLEELKNQADLLRGDHD